MDYERTTKYKRWWTKDAEASGTDLMPSQPPVDKTKKPTKATVKTAMMPHMLAKEASAGEEVVVPHKHWALPSIQRYPLDSYEHVKTAGVYFEQWGSHMSLEQRREYCQNLSKRAAALDMRVSPLVDQYGAEGYGEAVDELVDRRRSLLKEAGQHSMLDRLIEVRPLVPAEVFCQALLEMDKSAGLDRCWGRSIADPHLSTFGKTAEDELVMVGTEAVPKRAIVNGAITCRKSISTTFGEEVADAMMEDPMGIFNSLPRDQRKMIMRMVTDNSPNPDTTGSI